MFSFSIKHFTEFALLSSSFQCFWWEIRHYLYHCSTVCDVFSTGFLKIFYFYLDFSNLNMMYIHFCVCFLTLHEFTGLGLELQNSWFIWEGLGYYFFNIFLLHVFFFFWKWTMCITLVTVSQNKYSKLFKKVFFSLFFSLDNKYGSIT